MNTTDQSPVFFAKPSFRGSVQHEVLKGSARRALDAFDTGYRFSCSFFPSVAAQRERASRASSSGPQPASDASPNAEGLSAWELERLLERKLLPPFHDEARPTPPPPRKESFRPEIVELSALLVIVSVVLAKIFVG